MKWFGNLKISNKLIVSFLFIALLAGIVGGYGILSMQKTTDSSQDLFENYGNSQGYLSYVVGEYQKERAFMRDILVEKKNATSVASQKSITESDKTLMDYLSKYGTTCITADEKNEYKDLTAKIEAFRGMRDQVVAAGVKDNYDEAYKVGHTDVAVKTISDATAAIDKALKYQVTTGENQLKSLKQTSSTTMFWMFCIAAAAVILAVLLGILVSRVISKPIKYLCGMMNKLAAGENIEKTDGFKTKDEFGDLAIAFRKTLDAVDGLVSDMHMLTQAAMEGHLSARADASRHSGNYRAIIEGVNGTLDAIIQPIQEATGVLNEISKGNLNVRVTSDLKGDYAMIKDGLNGTAETLNGYIGEITSVLKEMNAGNLNVEIESEYKGDFIALKDSINSLVLALNSLISDINSASEQVASGTRQVSDGSQTISQGATEQASSIEELNASLTDIAAETKRNATNANMANELANVARNDAITGNDQMHGMQAAMEEINEASASIGKIIKVIDDIAFQTNILALNAAVEAARAGAYGKGFAVVAEEVRNLAAKSANAASETTAMIEGSIKKAEAGTKIANETAESLSHIVSSVEKAVDLVAEIASASNEQATAIAQVNKGIEQMSQVVQTNSATSEETAAAAEELSSQAELLKGLVANVRLKDSIHRSGETALKEGTLMADKPKKNTKEPKAKIILNDMEFGKY